MATPLRSREERPTGDTYARENGGPLVRLLTVPQLSEVLGLHPKTIYRLTRAGKLPCVRLGSRVRFLESDVLRWLSARKEG